MVTELPAEGDELAWLLQPTRSMSWAEARWFIAAVTAVSLLIGGVFLALGLPLVLPFSGLEAVAVGVAFYLVLRDGERRELVRLAGDELVIERGSRKLEDRLVFNRFWVSVELAEHPNRWYPRQLRVLARGRYIELGRFLTDGERESFARMLINALKKKR